MNEIYRRAHRTAAWHYHPACPEWPDLPLESFQQEVGAPATGVICDECTRLEIKERLEAFPTS